MGLLQGPARRWALRVGPSRVAASLGSEGGCTGFLLPPSSPRSEPPAVAPPSPSSPAAAGAELLTPCGCETSQTLPASCSARVPGVWRGPCVRELTTPADSGFNAQGRRRKAQHGHGHCCRWVSAEARALGGRGCRAQRRPKGSRPPEAPVSAGADPRQPLHEPSKDGPWSLSARTRAWWGEARAHACLSGCASFSCTH